MSGMAWARYWSRRRPAAAGSAVKLRVALSGAASGSLSSSSSSTGMGSGAGSSTPRVARYSARTEWCRWPLGSMFLEGMVLLFLGGGFGPDIDGYGLDVDGAGRHHHEQGYPLDGVEDGGEGQAVGVEAGVAQERDEELSDAGGGEGQGGRAGRVGGGGL